MDNKFSVLYDLDLVGRGQVDVLQDVDEVVESVELSEAGHGGPLDYCQGEDVEAEDHVESDEGVAQREQRVEGVVRGPGRGHAVVPPAAHTLSDQLALVASIVE